MQRFRRILNRIRLAFSKEDIGFWQNPTPDPIGSDQIRKLYRIIWVSMAVCKSGKNLRVWIKTHSLFYCVLRKVRL
jgi:hypothetical protein